MFFPNFLFLGAYIMQSCRQVDVLTAQGKSMAEAVRTIAVTTAFNFCF
jgi:hypothetical protein